MTSLETLQKKGIIVKIPSVKEIQNLQVGDLALDCFGRMKEVKTISAKRQDIKGRWFVCFATELGAKSTMTGSYKEQELVRTVPLSVELTSHECDQLEKLILQGVSS